jgi:hypothetical protein
MLTSPSAFHFPRMRGSFADDTKATGVLIHPTPSLDSQEAQMNFTQRAKDWVSTSTPTPDQLADAYLKMQTKSATLPDDQADDATACLEFLAESFESAGGDLALLIEAKPNVEQCAEVEGYAFDASPLVQYNDSVNELSADEKRAAFEQLKSQLGSHSVKA